MVAGSRTGHSMVKHENSILLRMTFSAIKSVLFPCKRNREAHPTLYLGNSARLDATNNTHLGIDSHHALTYDLTWHLRIKGSSWL